MALSVIGVYHRILVDREPLRIKRNHVAISVRTPMDIFGVQEEHRVRRRTADCRSARIVRRKRIGREALKAAVKHDIGIHKFEAFKADLGKIRSGILGRNPLDRL